MASSFRALSSNRRTFGRASSYGCTSDSRCPSTSKTAKPSPTGTGPTTSPSSASERPCDQLWKVRLVNAEKSPYSLQSGVDVAGDQRTREEFDEFCSRVDLLSQISRLFPSIYIETSDDDGLRHSELSFIAVVICVDVFFRNGTALCRGLLLKGF